MKIENLEVNKEYKNKNEVCKLLGVEKAKGGRNIKLQEKEFARYFNWKNTTGRKLIITEIYDKPKEKIDNRKGHSGTSEGSRNNNNIFSKDLKKILLHKLYNAKDNTITETTTNILCNNNIINISYRNLRNDKALQKIIFLNKKINQEFLNLFLQISDGNIKTMLENSLNSLQDKKIIEFEKVRLVKINALEQLNNAEDELKEYGINMEECREQIKENNQEIKFDEPDIEIELIIQEIEKEVLKELKLKSIAEAIRKCRMKEFIKLEHKKLQQTKELTKLGIEGWFYAYKIKLIDLDTDYNLTEEEERAIQIRLNKNFCDKLLINAKKRQDTTIITHLDLDAVIGLMRKKDFESIQDYYRSQPNYIEKIKFLINKYIFITRN